MEITNITSSYTRKINNKLYGGGDYESTDIFTSLSADLELTDDVLEKQKELHEICREMVNKSIEDEITSFSGGLTPDKFYTYIRDLVANRPIDGETYEQANPRQKAILQAIKRGKQMFKRDNNKQNVE